jgi:hypothetical protein
VISNLVAGEEPMRRMWKGLGWLAGLLVVAGCSSTEQQNLRPPPQPEQYILPPNDPKFAQPVAYPKDTLFADPNVKKDRDGNLTNPNMGQQRAPSTRLGGTAGMQ